MSDRFALAAVRPLVADQSVSGRYLMVTFRCPESGKQAQTRWQASQSSGLAASVGAAAQATLWYEVRRQANLFVRSYLGTNSIGRIAQTAVNSALASAPSGSTTGRHTLSASDASSLCFLPAPL